MQKITAQIFWLSLLCGCISIFYFLSLAIGLPVIVTTLLIIIASFFLYRKMMQWLVKPEVEAEPMPPKALYILLGSIVLFCIFEIFLSRKYGDWDSITIWNFHALFLRDPEHWKRIFLYTEYAHSDYPLLTSGTTAFFWRLFYPAMPGLVPFTLTAMFCTLVPVLIYLELYKKNLQLATLTLLVFLSNSYYLNCGIVQYADIDLSFFLLGAFVAINYYKKEAKPAYILLCGMMLGSCLWTKNEGIMIAAIFGLFYFRTFTKGKNLVYFLAGIAPFILGVAILKLVYAPANDLIDGQHKVAWQNILDKERYKLIFGYISDKLNERFSAIKIGLILYVLDCVFRQRFPAKNLLMLFVIMGGYILVYIYTPHDLEWHLKTSVDRLILQLVPAAVYIMSLDLSSLRLKTVEQ
ncbi:hypothetical protein [Taibaiella soli]|uniref:Glycosyltransferase RgtA/B/C/D-like domain-containing protein n=1 Tax=Taibaiella soli TaxID=1649169 RepID=A0A2W2BDL5_9BACT|nr:hypothetical protein [Taibaiella soli]PZF74349.1 hypothetical protein DN068_01850 [Taibaiella soli]